MKKSIFFFTVAILFFGFFGCSEKSCTQKSATHSEPKKEQSIEESLAEDLLTEFQDDLNSWNACIVYNGVEYTSVDDFRNRDK